MIKLPLVGPAYKLNAQSMSCQNCINWYPQTIEYPNGSRVAALMPTPGLKKIFQGDSASVRCLYILSNGALLIVIGKKIYHSKANRFDPQYVGDVSGLGTVKAADNGIVAIIVNGTYSYSLDMKTLEFKRLSGSTIPRSTHVLFLDGRFVVNKANTGQFYWSDLYSNKFDALSYATAESSPDKITALVTFNRELWIFGAQTVERYYSSGSQTSPYARLSGGAMAFGCTSPDSIVALATGVIWLSLSEFGGHQIVMSGGGVPERISTHAIEEEIASYNKTSDAIAYAYQQEGHVFYVISFPSASTTFCFDVSTGLWHQRSYASEQGLHERHRSQHHAFFNGIHIVGDYKNGKLYQLDKQTYTDDGDLILRERTAQAVITDGKLTRFNNLEIVCEVGFGDRKPKPAPQPPVISCVGAINSVRTGEVIPEAMTYEEYIAANSDPELSHIFTLDGQVVPLSTVLETISFEPIFDPQPDDLIPAEMIPAGYKDPAALGWGVMTDWTNITSQTHRLQLEYSKPVPMQLFFWRNPTADGNKVCLSASETPSCNPTYYAGDAVLSENYDPKAFEYKINDLDFVELTIAESGTYLTSSIFNAINADTGISDLFVAGGTGYYAFTDNGANFTVEGGDGSDTFDPITVVLRDSQSTIIADMFGSSEISLHSCGLATPIDT
ncbi:packaged DNA stabilization protein [Acinetobacter haemolyticus]|uniref:packaged DNA stabilization protein n=1 Tax=Acinetobacter haemolyticus TaxID=29430 RepID=UPI003AF658A9